MTDHATEYVTIDAPLDVVFAALSDFENYPEWAADIKETTISELDAEGRAVDVTFRAAAMGRSTTVRLRYDFAEAPERLVWAMTEGDLIRRYEGHYVLTAGETPDTTELEYQLTVELIVPIPGFVKRRAEARIIKAALPDLKAYIEAIHSQAP
jgi:uncharacterized protein YndB with AHSA1/START domain